MSEATEFYTEFYKKSSTDSHPEKNAKISFQHSGWMSSGVLK